MKYKCKIYFCRTLNDSTSSCKNDKNNFSLTRRKLLAVHLNIRLWLSTHRSPWCCSIVQRLWSAVLGDVVQRQSYWKRRNSRRIRDRRLLSAEIRRNRVLTPFSCSRLSDNQLLMNKFINWNNFNMFRVIHLCWEPTCLACTKSKLWELRLLLELESILLPSYWLAQSMYEWKIHRNN